MASEGRLGIRNIVSERSDPTNYAIRNVNNLVSDVLLFFRASLLQEIFQCTNIVRNYGLKEKWKLMNITGLKKFIGTLLLIGVYKSKGELVF